MKNKLPNIVSILILTVITSIMWISFNVYRSLTTEATPSVPREVSQALTPTLDKAVINDIQSRQFVNLEDIPTDVTIIIPTTTTPIPEISPSPESTQSASASPSIQPSPTLEGGGI